MMGKILDALGALVFGSIFGMVFVLYLIGYGI